MPITLSDLEIVDADLEKYNVSAFDCDDQDLNEFLRNDSPQYRETHLAWTKLALLQGKIVGFLCLSSDAISIAHDEHRWKPIVNVPIRHIPALKIGRLGALKELQKGGGVGRSLIRYAVGVAFRLNMDLRVGCRFLTVDAYPRSVEFYERVGFIKSEHKLYKNKKNPAMYFDILNGPEIGGPVLPSAPEQ